MQGPHPQRAPHRGKGPEHLSTLPLLFLLLLRLSYGSLEGEEKNTVIVPFLFSFFCLSPPLSVGNDQAVGAFGVACCGGYGATPGALQTVEMQLLPTLQAMASDTDMDVKSIAQVTPPPPLSFVFLQILRLPLSSIYTYSSSSFSSSSSSSRNFPSLTTPLHVPPSVFGY